MLFHAKKLPNTDPCNAKVVKDESLLILTCRQIWELDNNVIKIPGCGVLSRLLDVNAARLVLLGLGNNNAQDTILELGRDVVLVDTSGEVETARELAEGALGEPVLGLITRLLLDLLGLLVVGNFGALVSLGLGLILNLGVVRVLVLVVTLALANSALGLGALDEASGRSAGSVCALSLAADGHGLRLSEFNVDVFLGHARELSMKLVGLASLANIELGLPVGEAASTGTTVLLSLTRVAIEVVEETEEGSKGSIGVVEVAGEESHCVCVDVCVCVEERLL